jgi:hypothetical protein
VSVGGEGRRPKETAQTSPFTCQIPNYFSYRIITGIFKFSFQDSTRLGFKRAEDSGCNF